MQNKLTVFLLVFLLALVGCGGGGGDGDGDGGKPPEMTVFLQGEKSKLAFPGALLEWKVEVPPAITEEDVTFSVVKDSKGLSVDRTGKIIFQVPESAVPGHVYFLQVLVKDLVSGQEKEIQTQATVVRKELLTTQTLGSEGGNIELPDEDIALTIPFGSTEPGTEITISKGESADGEVIFRIESNKKTGEIVIDLPLKREIDDSYIQASSLLPSRTRGINTASAVNSFTLRYPDVPWWGIKAFLWDAEIGAGDGNRVDRQLKIKIEGEKLVKEFNFKKVSTLSASVPKTTEKSFFSDKEVVLFIHGYIPEAAAEGAEGLGGGASTWARFPQLIQGQGNHVAFEFRWVTAARFEDTAADLAFFIDMINEATGDRPIHIVAHSFGGVLTRTYLQGLAADSKWNDSRETIASLITIGSPHSGIADGQSTLPYGQDTTVRMPPYLDGALQIDRCQQLSCYQMGEPVSFSNYEKTNFKVSEKAGNLPLKLANLSTNTFPLGLPVKILIGANKTFEVVSQISGGDGLISYEGQRFEPMLTLYRTPDEYAALYDGVTRGRANVYEEFIGAPESNLIPGVYTPENFPGFRHSSWPVGPKGAKTEVQAEDSSHETFILVRDWITKNKGLTAMSWYRDFDGDQYGDPTDKVTSTYQPAGFISDNTDCNDVDIDIHPGAVDFPDDGIDQDCDGLDKTAASDADYIDSTTGMKFVYVEPGTFQMGEDFEDGIQNGPVHSVTLTKGYFIGTYEVTQEQWTSVMGDNPSEFNSCGVNCPVENVSWHDAQTFIDTFNAQTHRNYRLPTEAEWEFAARGGIKSLGYYYSGSDTLENVAWTNYDYHSAGPHPVGGKLPNELGIYDMSGNVWEWTQDWLSDYTSSPETDPQGPTSGSYRVLRGGWSGDTEGTSVARRSFSRPYDLSKLYGFRIVLPEDEALSSWYADFDGDGFGSPDDFINSVAQPENYVSDNTDCDDGNMDINPAAEEVRDDGIDQDCSGYDATSATGPTYNDPSTGMAFTYIEPGTFQMGDVSSFFSSPVHSVTLTQGYYMGTYEVTQDQWQTVMGNNPSFFRACGGDCPVEQVSWNDIQSFVNTLNTQTGNNYRLPTEAEWEFAARGGVLSQGYQYAGSDTVDLVAWGYSNSAEITHPVGQKQPNELGLYDMSGNVFEWTQDWYSGYTDSPETDPKGPASGRERIVRGGGWNASSEYLRSGNRTKLGPDYPNDYIGFRLVLPSAQ